MITFRQRLATGAIAIEVLLDLVAIAVLAMPLNTAQKTWGLVVIFALTVLWNVVLFITFMSVAPGNPAASPPVVGPSVATIKTGIFTVVIEIVLDAIALSLLLIPMGLTSSVILTLLAIIIVITLIWDGVMAFFILR